jgi:hypothetical protein
MGAYFQENLVAALWDIWLDLCMQRKIIPRNLNPEPLMSGPEIAQYYGVDPATIRRWRREGMPSHPRGLKLVRYRLSECEGWLKSQRASV